MSNTGKILYTAKTHTIGGRDGAARSSDGQLDIKLASPGTKRSGTNPEQLFAAGWSACFEGALGLAAKERGVKLPEETAVDAEVDLLLDEAEGYRIAARLNVGLPGLDRATALALVERAHQTCPYSKLTRGGIDAAVTLA